MPPAAMASSPRQADSPRTAQLVQALQDLAEDTLECSAQLHTRIDKLALRVQSLWGFACALERRIVQLEGLPESTDAPPSLSLAELD